MIVRLIGLYLITICGAGLFQFHQIHSFVGIFGVSTQQQALISNLQSYLAIGLTVGLVATGFAGPLARLLTFDAEPRGGAADLADQLLKK